MKRVVTRYKKNRAKRGQKKSKAEKKLYDARWRAENREYLREYRRKYGAAHRERLREMQHGYDAARFNARRAYRLKRLYNLSVLEYEAMLARQKHRCAACETRFERKHLLKPVVDHDHRTGRIRGILCNRCNAVLGMVFDNPGILQGLITYSVWTHDTVRSEKLGA